MKNFNFYLFLLLPFLVKAQPIEVTFMPITVDANTIKIEVRAKNNSTTSTQYLAAIPSGWNYAAPNNLVGSVGSWENAPGVNLNSPGSYTFTASRLAYAQVVPAAPANRMLLSTTPQLVGTLTVDMIPTVGFPFSVTPRTSGANSLQVTTYNTNVTPPVGMPDPAVTHTVASGGVVVATTPMIFLGPFPIRLSTFSAIAKGKNNVINWTTSSEYNSNVQVIEASQDGLSAWYKIAQVKSRNSASGASYEVVDIAPKLLTYYRLRSIDYDGQEEFSEVVSVLRETTRTSQLRSVTPIPATTDLTLDFDLSSEGEITYKVISAVGAELITMTVGALEGANSIKIDLDNIPAGTYTVVLMGADLQASKQFIKH
jgi:hypothetical protein